MIKRILEKDTSKQDIALIVNHIFNTNNINSIKNSVFMLLSNLDDHSIKQLKKYVSLLS